MGRKAIEDPIADIDFTVPAGPGFADQPRPDLGANEAARMMTGNAPLQGPVAMPADGLGADGKPLSQPHPFDPGARVFAGQQRSIRQIVDDFIRDVANHPDGKLLTSTIDAQADDGEAQVFPGSAPSALRVDNIRLVRRMRHEMIPITEGQQARKRWQDEVLAQHHASMAEQQKARASSWRGRSEQPAGLSAEALAAVVAQTVATVMAAQNAQKVPAA
jgi:hypothetical protein